MDSRLLSPPSSEVGTNTADALTRLLDAKKIEAQGIEGFEKWRAAIDALEARNVIAGHRDATRSDTAAPQIAQTHDYLEAAESVLVGASKRREIFDELVDAFPQRANPFVAWFCALALRPD